MIRRFAVATTLTLCVTAFLPDLTALASPEQVDLLVRTAMNLDKHPDKGKKLFAKSCAVCHSEDASGNSAKVIPALAGQRQAYVIKQLADFSQRERDSSAMHAVVTQPELREPQAWADLASYLNSSEPAPSPETGSGKDLELGEAIFGEQCASCHEEDGRGDDDGFVPSLRNQHYSYLVKQVENFAAWHRRNVDEDLIRFLVSFDQDERMAVADYLSRLRGPTRDRTKLNDDGTSGD
ncbi:MAG: c-type cytochrome [Povalibacter sp.]